MMIWLELFRLSNGIEDHIKKLELKLAFSKKRCIFVKIIIMKKYLTLQNLGWVLTTLASILVLTSGAQKAIATQEMVGNFTYLKLLPYLTLVGVLEVVGAFLLVFNRTSIYGAALIGSLMSAAVVIHLSVLGTSPLVPIVIGLLAWVGYSLRNFAVQKA